MIRSPAACSTTPVSRRVSMIRSRRRGGVAPVELRAARRAPRPRGPAAAAAAAPRPRRSSDGAATSRAGTPPTTSSSVAGPDQVVERRAIRRPPRARPPGPGARPCAGRAPRRTAAGVGKILPGLASPAGSNAHRTSCMVSRSSSVNIRGMYFALSMPTPCSPVIEPPYSTHRSRIAPDTSSARSASPSTRVVEQHQRVQVAVAGVEDVRHPDAVARRRARAIAAQHLGQRGPRDHAVLHDVVGADPADRGERRLAALPEQRPLGVVGGDPDLERAVVPAQRARPGRTGRPPRRPARPARRSAPRPAPAG